MTTPETHSASAPFADLLAGLDSARSRDRTALDDFARLEEARRPGGRDHGTEFARDELRLAYERTGELRELFAALLPHEAAVRAILAGGASA